MDNILSILVGLVSVFVVAVVGLILGVSPGVLIPLGVTTFVITAYVTMAFLDYGKEEKK